MASLGAGTYTIEATTYAAGTTGSFTLTVTTVPVSDTTTPEPPDPPTPDPTPGDPTSPIPAGCTLQNFSGTSVDDSWTSDCVSSNRTENGTHYAKFFSFSVSRSATYDLTLESRTDTYLILLDDEGNIIKLRTTTTKTASSTSAQEAPALGYRSSPETTSSKRPHTPAQPQATSH